ncbi:MAG: biotin-dependent carboxyltransferase family protein [Porticoccaceae bacterium]|nr:biotin-dependent carboxyltransferase family protein [Porticoccaceae bacterium]
MSGLIVIQPGIFSLAQDSGRFGLHSIGLTTGGPMDRNAFRWANRLCDNSQSATAIEVTVGGLVLESTTTTNIAMTGANIPLTINQQAAALWQSHKIIPGDRIELGFAVAGSRGYLAVAGGFQIEPIFNSVSTVPREGLGGTTQDGTPLQAGQILPCQALQHPLDCLSVPSQQRPDYAANQARVRVVLGYQQDAFSEIQKQLFFSSQYTVSDSSDRMGYRLKGPNISPSIDGILSEGICLGAIQVPADGQPIILLNDRQTIGGYPKLGSVLSLDLGKLAQLMPGGTVQFEAISVERAHNLLALDEQRFNNSQLEPANK